MARQEAISFSNSSAAVITSCEPTTNEDFYHVCCHMQCFTEFSHLQSHLQSVVLISSWLNFFFEHQFPLRAALFNKVRANLLSPIIVRLAQLNRKAFLLYYKQKKGHRVMTNRKHLKNRPFRKPNRISTETLNPKLTGDCRVNFDTPLRFLPFIDAFVIQYTDCLIISV